MITNHRAAKRSLLPILLFISLFLGTGLTLQFFGVDHPFQQLPGQVAIIPALILAVILNPKSLADSIAVLIKGAGNDNIITMCFIFLLAGAFSSVATATGGVDAVVNAGLLLVPPGYILPGLFVIAALISLAMGTSVGTIAALAPIALGFAEQTGTGEPLIAGALLGGAMFGDNLSIISDTTIASTRTQVVGMKEKFWENMKFALPAFIITTLVFGFLATDSAPITPEAFSWAATLPYLAILVLAVSGMNVFLVLLLGIVMAALQGVFFTGYEISALGTDIAGGFADMQGIFILAMFVGSLGEFIKQQGGLQWISDHINRLAEKVSRTGNFAQQFAIGVLVFITDYCIANNVVSIVVTGDLSRDLARKHDISPKRSATVLDTFACIAQGFLPYGNQALLLSGTFAISPWEVVTHNYFGAALLVVTIAVIFLGTLSQNPLVISE
ncbi:sodium:proton antiporter [Aliifodinibius salipaludis]|uniref:Sodium:proton antiporter n=1 Tax=Fodinibius salipaludis TaxID=2032627 RepID=A0A2A2GAG6_9BACT|nr:Na+/H+ antiporter NhaC family protein [Aliifodinibius salipaludis]PAU94160.1 sodium:proton antiporter [Aliifodinibius salipaludis]